MINAKDQITVEVGADLEIATRLAKMMEKQPHLFKKQDGKPRDGPDPVTNDATDSPSDAKTKPTTKPKGKAKAKPKAKAGVCRISV